VDRFEFGVLAAEKVSCAATAAAKAGIESKVVIAALKRCATQSQSQHRAVHSLLVNSAVARIERKVQFEDVHARLAQESPLPVLGVLKDQAGDLSFRNLTF
jgi:hypothetical protein